MGDITNAKVEVMCKVTFEADGKVIETQLFAREAKAAITKAVKIYRDKQKEKENVADTAKTELDEVLDKATDMAEPDDAPAETE